MRKYYNITGEAFEHGPNMLLFCFAFLLIYNLFVLT